MNHLTRIFSLLILVSAGVFYSSCDGDDTPPKSEEELQLDKLKVAQWTLLSVDNNATDRTSEYPAMTLTFSGTFSAGGTYSYTSSATSWPSLSPWKKDDTWKFQSGSVTSTIVRLSDDQVMTYTFSNSDKELSISFDYSGPGFFNGRVESVAGPWTFVFTRP